MSEEHAPPRTSTEPGRARRTLTRAPPGAPAETEYYPDRSGSYREPRAIRVLRRGEQPFVLPIYADVRYSFGRERTCDVVFADDSISRLHGVLTYLPDGRWVYRDMGSRNGSFLSGEMEVPDDETLEDVDPIHPGRGYVVAAGQSVLLANRAGRIAFLSEVPVRAPSEHGDRTSPATEKLRRHIEVNAGHHLPVFLLGATGSGKTWAARRIHEQSGLAGSFVSVNCGALSTQMDSLKSELLGHTKGAFTGAVTARQGKLPHAAGGTLFLDEVESLAPEAQAFLLDLLDGTGNFAPLGAQGDLSVPPPPFRLISASKKPLRQTGLREDLCNRLARGGIVLIPGLDERRDDIPLLVETFVKKVNAEHHMDVHFDPEAVALLQAHDWTDHVRGLEGVVGLLAQLAHAKGGASRAGATGIFRRVDNDAVEKIKTAVVVPADDVREHLEARQAAFGDAQVLPPPPDRLKHKNAQGGVKRPKHYTRDELEAALAQNAGNLTRTARALGMVVNTLKTRMAELGIRRGPAEG